MKSSYSFGNKQVHQRFTKGFLSLVFLALIACESGSDSPPTPQDSTPEQFFSFQYEFQTSIDDPDISGQIRIGTRFDPFTLETVPIENSDLFAGTLTYEAGDKGTLRIAGKTYSSKNGKSGNGSQLETTQLELRQVTLEKEGFIAQTISNPSPTETNTAEFEVDPNATQSVDLYLTARLGPQQIDGVIFFLKQSDRPLDSLAIIIPKDTPGQRLAIEEDFIYNSSLDYKISVFDWDEANGGIQGDARFKPFSEDLIIDPINGASVYQAILPELEQEVDYQVSAKDDRGQPFPGAEIKRTYILPGSTEEQVEFYTADALGNIYIENIPSGTRQKFSFTEKDVVSAYGRPYLISNHSYFEVPDVDSVADLGNAVSGTIAERPVFSEIMGFEGPIPEEYIQNFRMQALPKHFMKGWGEPGKLWFENPSDINKFIPYLARMNFGNHQIVIDPSEADIRFYVGSDAETIPTYEASPYDIVYTVAADATYNPAQEGTLIHEGFNATGFEPLAPGDFPMELISHLNLDLDRVPSARYSEQPDELSPMDSNLIGLYGTQATFLEAGFTINPGQFNQKFIPLNYSFPTFQVYTESNWND